MGAGKLILVWDGRKVKLSRAVNSFVTTVDGMGDSFKKIKLVEIMGLPYGKAQDLRQMAVDQDVHILLAGCPELKDSALKEKFGGVTPADTVKAMLLPGEIADLSRAVERLTGFRQNTISEIKNG